MGRSHVPVLLVLAALAVGAGFLLRRGGGGTPDPEPRPPAAGAATHVPAGGGSAQRGAERRRSGSSGEDPGGRLRLAGVVLSPEGRALPGAVVGLHAFAGPPRFRATPGRPALEVRTDRRGEFVFAGLDATSTHALVAEHADAAIGVVWVEGPVQEGERFVEIHLAGGTVVRGAVIDTADVPLAGASVRIADPGVSRGGGRSGRVREAVTDEAGRYEIRGVQEGTWRLDVRRDGFAAVEILALRVGEERGDLILPDLVLSRSAGALAGVVRDEGGRPVRGALVTANALEVPPPRRVSVPRSDGLRDPSPRIDVREILMDEVATDDEGRFRFEAPAEVAHAVVARCRGFRPSDRITATPGSPDIEIRLQATPGIAGVVTDETGRPVAGAEVFLGRDLAGVAGPGLPRFQADPSDGTFLITDVMPGIYAVLAEAPGFAGGTSDGPVAVGSDGARGVVVRMARGAVIVGHVLGPDGRGLPGAAVEVRPHAAAAEEAEAHRIARIASGRRPGIREARTDERGRFTVPGVRQGDHIVVASHPAGAPWTSPPLTLPAGGEIDVGEIRLEAGGVLSGLVSPELAGPPAGIHAALTSRSDPGFHRRIALAADGSFVVGGLGAGDYMLIVMSARGGGAAPLFTRRIEVKIRAGETTNVSVER